MKNKSFIVIGLGRFGANIAKTLVNNNCDVLAVDTKEEAVLGVSSFVSHCVVADASKLNVLKELGASNIDHAVVAIGNNLQASILATINLKNLGVKNITVRADEVSHKEVFTLIGATDVIIPEEESAKSIANRIIGDGILDYYTITDDYALVQVSVGKDFTPKTLIELDVRNKFDINIVGIVKGNDKFYIPRGTDEIKPGDVVVVVGTNHRIKKFSDFLND